MTKLAWATTVLPLALATVSVAAPMATAGAPGAPQPALVKPAEPAAYAPGSVLGDDTTVPGRLLLVLDASGSMNGKDPSGLTKIAAAKKALVAVVNGLPADAQVGLRVYGATQAGGKPTPAACADTQLVHPISVLDKPGLNAAIDRFKAKGETPIAHSIDEAVTDLGAAGKRNIVLVSDGEESCVPDPCPSITKAVGAGIDLQIDTVGFGVNSKARQQLQCIADAGHGSYYDARDAEALSASLDKLSQRALRPFTITGTPVIATERAEEAAVLTPGQYTDSFAPGAPVRYLRLTRQPGSDVRFTLTSRPPKNSDLFALEQFSLKVTTPEGEECKDATESRLDAGAGKLSKAVTVSARVRGTSTTGTASSTDDTCAAAGELLVAVQHEKGRSVTEPVELLYIEEPAITNASALPPPLDPAAVKPQLAPADGAGTPVVGGGAFSNALTLTPGTYVETILPGEQIFYRVHLDFGQRAAFTADIPVPGQRIDLDSLHPVQIDMNVFNPAHVDLTDLTGPPEDNGLLTYRGDPLVLGTYVPEVRWANREAYGNGRYSFLHLRETSIAGFYYVAVARAAAKPADSSSVPIDIRLRVAVTGTPQGEPAYAGATPNPAPTSSTLTTSATSGRVAGTPTPDTSSSSWLAWVGGGALVLVSASSGGYLVVRRRRAAGTHGGQP